MLKQLDRPPKCKAERKNQKKAKTNIVNKSEAVSAAPVVAAAVAPVLTEEAPAKAEVLKKKVSRKKTSDVADKVSARKAELTAELKAKEKERAEKVKAEKKAAVAALKAKAAPPKKRGLSLEEKCCRFESHLATTEGIFTLKELEKIGPTIGVIPQAVKDVIVCLLKERRIKCEKVGASNIYWLFKHDLSESRAKELLSLKEEIKSLEIALTTLRSSSEALDEQALLNYMQLPAPIRAQRIKTTREAVTESRVTLMQIESVKAICPTKYQSVSLATHALARRNASELDFYGEMNFGA